MDYPVITLCGSTKFKDEFLRIQKELTLKGNIVLSVGCFGHSGDSFTDEQKQMLDDMHKRKIDMSDAIFVIDKDGYIGESTKSEIEYAKQQHKSIFYLSLFTRNDYISKYDLLGRYMHFMKDPTGKVIGYVTAEDIQNMKGINL